MIKITKKFTGVIVPMVTPFTIDLSIDTAATAKIIDSFIEAGVSPFLLGTTGESVSITNNQKKLFVKTAATHIDKKLNLFAGISGNSLHESIENAKMYADFGADAVVAHLPFYYPMSSDQMLKYYEQMANEVPCPLILYNNPITTNYSIPLDVIEKLSHHDNVYGVKDSERGIERLDNSIMLWAHRPDFAHFTGWAAQSAYALLKGSDGIVPSTGNIIPKTYKELYGAARQGNASKANELQEITNKVSEIYQKNRNLSQSIPALKEMMAKKELCQNYVMPPMFTLNEAEQDQVKKLMKEEAGFINE